MGIKYLVVFLGLFVLYHVVQHERHKFDVLLHDCHDQHMLDRRLLVQDICMDPESRADFEGKGMVDCKGAQERLKVSASACAAHKWRQTSEIAHIYRLFTQSYWSMMGLLALFMSSGVWLLWKTQRDNKLIKEYRQTVTRSDQMGPIMRIANN